MISFFSPFEGDNALSRRQLLGSTLIWINDVCPYIAPVRTSLDNDLADVTWSDIGLIGRGNLGNGDIDGILAIHLLPLEFSHRIGDTDLDDRTSPLVSKPDGIDRIHLAFATGRLVDVDIDGMLEMGIGLTHSGLRHLIDVKQINIYIVFASREGMGRRTVRTVEDRLLVQPVHRLFLREIIHLIVLRPCDGREKQKGEDEEITFVCHNVFDW